MDQEMFRPLCGREFRLEKDLYEALRDIFLAKENRGRISPDWTIGDAFDFACRRGLVWFDRGEDGVKVITFRLGSAPRMECVCPMCGDEHARQR